jgi:hypothetical protein
MNNRQSRLLKAADRAVTFARDLPKASPRITKAAAQLKEAVRAARAAELVQSGAKRARKTPRYSVTQAKTILLRKHLGPIAADGVVMFDGLPGIEEDLRLPRIKDAAEKHLEAAKRLQRVAEEHEEEFIEQRNYDGNFLEKFQRAVEDLEAAAGIDRGFVRAKYTRATVDMKDEITRVRRAFDVLDARVLEEYLDDRSQLRQWRRASRIPPKMGRPKLPKTDDKRVHRAKPRETIEADRPG